VAYDVGEEGREVDRYTRWSRLLDLLAAHGRLTVDEAANLLGVSAATVRRDLEGLARDRKLVRARGAALHTPPAIANLLDGVRPPANAVARRIAAATAGTVDPRTVVGLVGPAESDLTAAIGRAIAAAVAPGTADGHEPHGAPGRAGRPGLTLVTNDVAVGAELLQRPGVKVVLTGGVLSTSLTTAGPLAGLLLGGISLDTVIVAADAADPVDGVSDADEVCASVAVAMIGRARRVVVAVRSRDLDRTAFARICGPERIDVVVTDAAAAPATTERFARRGVHVVRA
jgi:DeoR family transcriptional regulator of aga operon